MTRPDAILLRLLIICLVCGLATFSAKGDADLPSKLPPAPPPPVPATVKVLRGEKVEIPLGIYGSQTGSIRFLVRIKPEHGQLSEIARTGPATATVTYATPANIAITQDRFFYSAQNPNGVSSPVEVKIVIVDPPPQLEVPTTLDFPATLIGSTSTGTLRLLNKGGSFAEGEMQVEGPWEMEGSTHYRIGAGGSQTFTLVFRPDHAGQASGDIIYSTRRDHSTLLEGPAEDPIAIDPPTVTLKSQPGNAIRHGSFHVINHTDADLAVQISAGNRLVVASSVTAPAQGDVVVNVQTKADDLTSLRDDLHIAAGGREIAVPVTGPAPGPILRAILASGEPKADAKTGRITAVSIENLGGAGGSWTCRIAPPFQVSSATCELMPGRKQIVEVSLPAGETGRHRAFLEITGEGQSAEIPIDAAALTARSAASRPAGPPASFSHLTAASTASAALALAIPGAAPSLAAPDPVASEGASEDSGEISLLDTSSMLPVLRHGVTATPTSASIAVPKEKASPGGYKIEERVLSLGKEHDLQIDWIERQPTKTQAEGKNTVMELQGLKPASHYRLRFSPLEAKGVIDAPSFVADFFTPPAGSRSIVRSTWFWVGFVSVLLSVGFFLRRRRLAAA